MDFELQKTMLAFFEEFTERRTDTAVIALKQNGEYLRISARREQINKEMFELSTKTRDYAFELDDLVGQIIYMNTLAAYKQGFDDAQQIQEVSKWHPALFFRRSP